MSPAAADALARCLCAFPPETVKLVIELAEQRRHTVDTMPRMLNDGTPIVTAPTLTTEQREQLRVDAWDEERPWVTEPTEAERPRTGEERAIEEDEFYGRFGFTASEIEEGDREYDARTGN